MDGSRLAKNVHNGNPEEKDHLGEMAAQGKGGISEKKKKPNQDGRGKDLRGIYTLSQF